MKTTTTQALKTKEIVKEYKKGKEKNFFLREFEGTYFLEKITKSCGFTIKCGTEKEVNDYIKNNNFQFVREVEKQY
jgi:hypothetical protein